LFRSTDNGASWSVVVNAPTLTTVGDGTRLYTESFNQTSQPSQSVLTSTDGMHWTAMGQTTCSSSGCTGVANMAYDPVHHLVYSTNFFAGVWRLSVGGTSSSSSIPTTTRVAVKVETTRSNCRSSQEATHR
jgi:hypothetical protein